MTVRDKNIETFLVNSFATNRTAHAYIVVGEKHQLPDLLKQCALICMCKTHSGTDNCDICRKVQCNLHQDVVRIPREKARISVADMVALVEESYKRPIEGGDCRVFLVDASESVVGVGSEIWQNKLLKTLEEPTDNTYIFIGVTDAESLLPTIRSRCQVIRQCKVGAKEVCLAMQQKGFEKGLCEVVASVSGGSVYTAESIFSNPAILRAFNTALDVLQNMTSTKNALQFVSEILAEKDTVVWCLTFMTVLLRESIVYRLAENLCLLPSYGKDVEKICQNYSLQAAEVCIEKISSAKKRIDDGGNLTVVTDQLASTILEVKYRCRI